MLPSPFHWRCNRRVSHYNFFLFLRAPPFVAREALHEGALFSMTAKHTQRLGDVLVQGWAKEKGGKQLDRAHLAGTDKIEEVLVEGKDSSSGTVLSSFGTLLKLSLKSISSMGLQIRTSSVAFLTKLRSLALLIQLWSVCLKCLVQSKC